MGHFHGVLQNWLSLQSQYECFFFVADLHALTTEYPNPEKVKAWTEDVLLDWLSVGVDPEKAVLFVQSDVPEHSEFHVLLSMITPLGWLERVPSYKELQQELTNKDLSTYGFLGYPVLQTADVALYEGEKIPVGQDQVAHIELSREIVRRFNYLYKGALPEPQPMLTPAPKFLGPDRRKMSKSYGNSIYLSDTPEEVSKKVMSSITDPERVRKDDPGHPEVCLIFDYHKLHSTPERVLEVEKDCREARLGCVADKREMAERLNAFLEPIRKKRQELSQNKDYLESIRKKGQARAQEEARKTLSKVREWMTQGGGHV